MNILFAGTIDFSTQRGDTLHFLHLANALRLRGHLLDVVGWNTASGPLADGLTVYSTKRSMKKGGATLLNDIKLLWKVLRLSKFHYDIFYQRGIPLANRVLRTRGIPSILEVNGDRLDELRLRGFNSIRLASHRLREMEIIKYADHYICVTEGIRAQIIEQYHVDEKKCTVIPNAADTDLFRPLPQDQCQQILGLAQDMFHIGFVGTFQPWVDFDSLFTSLQILRNLGVPVYCTLVGDGSLESELRQQVLKRGLSDIVRFTGRQNHQDIPKWMGAFDVGIAPFIRARNETIGLSPLKLFEYMACERPVVAPTLPGIIEPVEAAQAGRLYLIEDQESLAHQLSWLYQNPTLKVQMGKKGRAYVLKHHSWANVAEKIEKIMQECVTQTKLACRNKNNT